MLEKYINEEVKFLIYMFVENGHRRSFLENFVPEYQNMSNKTNSFKIIKNLSWIPNIGTKLRL